MGVLPVHRKERKWEEMEKPEEWKKKGGWGRPGPPPRRRALGSRRG
jgi:hypothetical protein